MARFMRRPLLLMALAILTLAYLVAVPAPAHATPTSEAAPRPPTAIGVIAKSLRPVGLSVQAASRIAPVTYPVPPGKTAEGYASELRATGRFAYAEPNYIRTVTAHTSTPNDPDFNDPGQWYWGSLLVDHAKSWYLRGAGSANFDKVWPNLAVDGAAYHARVAAPAVPVGIIDTGFYMNHPDRGDIVAKKDCLSYYSTATGRHTGLDVTPVPASAPLNSEANTAHGTLTASLVGEASNNGLGTASAGYDAKVYIYKAQGTWLEGDAWAGYPAGAVIMTDDAVIDGIRTATDDGCKVISMSLGGPSSSVAMQDAINYAWSHGAVVVASAGNNGASPVLYPAAANHVIAVGSVFLTSLSQPVRSTFSNYGAGLDIMAPGEGIWGPTRPGYIANWGSVSGYTWWSGTSMAAPLVAAAAATVLRLEPTLTPDEVAGILTSSATDMGLPGYDTTTGWGELNVQAAIAKVAATYPLLLPPRLSGITESTLYSTNPTLTLSWTPVAGYGPVTYTVRGDWTSTPLYSGTGTTLRITGIPDGTRQISVTPESPRNWSDASSMATVRFGVGDTIAPVTMASFTPSTGSVYAANQAVTLNASDNSGGSGVKTTYYKIDSASFVVGTSFTVTGDGPHTFSYYSVDHANNTESTRVSNQFRIDTMAPSTTSSAVSGRTYTGAQRFTLTPTDPNGSGVAGTWWQLDSTGGSWTSGTSVVVAAPILGALSHTLYFYSRDAAGNAETPYKQVEFTVSAPYVPQNVYRFYNLNAGVHFYTASESEMRNVRNTLGGVYRFEGPSYSINLSNPTNTLPVYRFYNIKKGVHFYTASAAERDTVINTLGGVYRFEGPSYNVSTTATNAFPVYRFYNLKQGVHFYTSSETEKQNVIDTLSGVYRFEGISYYVGK